jgi:hypothetical protein
MTGAGRAARGEDVLPHFLHQIQVPSLCQQCSSFTPFKGAAGLLNALNAKSGFQPSRENLLDAALDVCIF